MLPALLALMNVAQAVPLPSVVTVEALERLRVPAGARFDVDGLLGTIEVRPRLATVQSTLCPTVEQLPKATRLRCLTHHMQVRIVSTAAGAVLEIAQTHAAPRVDGDATLPLITYDPLTIGIGGRCPGDTAASQGECLLAAGNVAAAVKSFTAALETHHWAFAAMRLGDVANSVGDLDRAAGFWDRAGPTGPFARMAGARLCEYTGGCFARTVDGVPFDAMDDVGLPAPLANEMILRHARVIAYEGRVGEAVTFLVERSTSTVMSPCARAPALCRRFALEALRDEPTKSAGLALYLTLPGRDGAQSRELTLLAAEHSASIGAPQFAANLLVASTATTPLGELEATLLRAAELYLDADDMVHAASVAGFARTRLTRLRDPARWRKVYERVGASGWLEAHETTTTRRSPPASHAAAPKEGT